MTDWLGMAASPMTPRPELKARVLARAFASRRRPWWALAAAAVFVLATAGGALWAGRSIRALEAERALLAARIESLRDTLSLIRGPGTRVVQIPVSTDGRVGAVTIFTDSITHRWLIACHHLAPNRPDQAYQVWFITERGMRSATMMPMENDAPMVAVAPLPANAGRVMGVAMSIEPRSGSEQPKGPMLFHLNL